MLHGLGTPQNGAVSSIALLGGGLQEQGEDRNEHTECEEWAEGELGVPTERIPDPERKHEAQREPGLRPSSPSGWR
jgi:hypothetical protein